MARVLKNVSFNDTDKLDSEIMNYLDEYIPSFGSYVKELILRDMKNVTNSNNTELTSMANSLKDLVAVLSSGSVSIASSNSETATAINEPATDFTGELPDDTQKDIISSVFDLQGSV